MLEMVQVQKMSPVVLDINQIKNLIPHRFPFLLVDRIIELEKGKKAVGIKNVTVDDFFSQQQYFNSEYLLSGALQVEAMAQVAGFVISDLMEETKGIPLFAGFEKVRFRRPARPGDQLRIEVELLKVKAKVSKFSAKTYIDDEIASEASFTCMIGNE
jgi:3-hydroxyacyl-[acyl-carrier-protein] dehydratase